MKLLNAKIKRSWGLKKGEIGIVYNGRLAGVVDSTTYYKPGGSKGKLGHAELKQVRFFSDLDYMDICGNFRLFDLVWMASSGVVKFINCWVVNEKAAYQYPRGMEVDVDIDYLAWHEVGYV
jgi:hypothetical protein